MSNEPGNFRQRDLIGLQMGHIGVTAAMGAELPDAGDPLQCGIIFVAESSHAIQQTLPGGGPDVRLSTMRSKVYCIWTVVLGNRYSPTTPLALGWADARLSDYHPDGLVDTDLSAILSDVLGPKRQQFLYPQPTAKQKPDTVAQKVIAQIFL